MLQMCDYTGCKFSYFHVQFIRYMIAYIILLTPHDHHMAKALCLLTYGHSFTTLLLW